MFPKAAFTLIFLAAPKDMQSSKAGGAPELELTFNWDPEDYDYGRNFGHLAYKVDNIYETCQQLMDAGVVINRPRPRWADGIYQVARQYLNRIATRRRFPTSNRTMAFDGKYGKLVGIFAAG